MGWFLFWCYVADLGYLFGQQVRRSKISYAMGRYHSYEYRSRRITNDHEIDDDRRYGLSYDTQKQQHGLEPTPVDPYQYYAPQGNGVYS